MSTTTRFTLPKYSDVITNGKALLEKITAPIKTMQAKKQVEMQILTIEEQQAKLELQMNEAYDKVPFDVKSVYALKNQHDLLERERAFYASVLTDSF